ATALPHQGTAVAGSSRPLQPWPKSQGCKRPFFSLTPAAVVVGTVHIHSLVLGGAIVVVPCVIGNDQSTDDIQQQSAAAEKDHHSPGQTHQGGIDAEKLGDAAAHTGQYPIIAAFVQSFHSTSPFPLTGSDI